MHNSKELQITFENQGVEDVFLSYPKNILPRLLLLRYLIFDTALNTKGVGELEETLKWGQPSYLTTKSKSGSTIRIDQVKSQEGKYAIFFICNTNLVETFKEMYPAKFSYGGDRCIIFKESDSIPEQELRNCIALALTYHRTKKRKKLPTNY